MDCSTELPTVNDRFPAADFSSGSRELIHSHWHMTFEATTARGAAKRPSVAHQWPTFLRPQWPKFCRPEADANDWSASGTCRCRSYGTCSRRESDNRRSLALSGAVATQRQISVYDDAGIEAACQGSGMATVAMTDQRLASIACMPKRHNDMSTGHALLL